MTGLEVVTLATVPRPLEGDVLLGILGKQEGKWTFVLAGLEDCAHIQELARLPVEFDYRTAPIPEDGGGGSLAKNNGVKRAWYASRDEWTFVHYDGYSVRQVTASRVTTGSQVSDAAPSVESDAAATEVNDSGANDAAASEVAFSRAQWRLVHYDHRSRATRRHGDSFEMNEEMNVKTSRTATNWCVLACASL